MLAAIRLDRLLFIVLLLTLAGPAVRAEAADRSTIESAAQAWIQAFNARELERLMSAMTEHPVLIDPQLPPVSGAKAVRKALSQAMSSTGGNLRSATKEITVVDDVAWRIGALTHAAQSGLTSTGYALEIWKRIDGRWKLHRQMSSNLLRAPRLVPQPLPPEPVLDKQAN